MVNKQLYQLIEYARQMPHFAKLHRDDQITLLRAGWNELLIATVAWRSIEVKCAFRFIAMKMHWFRRLIAHRKIPISENSQCNHLNRLNYNYKPFLRITKKNLY